MTYTPNPGDYVLVDALPEEALAHFLDDMLRAGAREGSPLVRAQEREYFGWDLRDNTIYAYNSCEVGSHTLFHNNVTDYYRRDHAVATNTAHYQEKTTMPTIRNPFQEGDRVVPNGFKAHAYADHHCYGTNSIMEQWEADADVLHVERITGNDRISVRKDSSTSTYTYHPAELRMATAEEIAKADAPEQPPLATGTVIKSKDTGSVMIVVEPEPDEDGDIRVVGLGRFYRTYFRPDRGYTILGQIMEDGELRPAETIHNATDPSQWKEGQKVRCITDRMFYVTKGRVYTLVEDASTNSHGDTNITILDNDGDESTYRVADQFEAV